MKEVLFFMCGRNAIFCCTFCHCAFCPFALFDCMFSRFASSLCRFCASNIGMACSTSFSAPLHMWFERFVVIRQLKIRLPYSEKLVALKTT